MAAEEDEDGGPDRGVRAAAVAVAAVDAARPGAVCRAAPAEARGWRPPARRLPPDPVRERHLLPAVGDRVRHRPRASSASSSCASASACDKPGRLDQDLASASASSCVPSMM